MATNLRTQIIRTARDIFDTNDDDLAYIQRIIESTGQDVAKDIATFINDDKHWNVKAPKAEVNSLMTNLAELAANSTTEHANFLKASLSTMPVKTNGDVLNAGIAIKLADTNGKIKAHVGSNLDKIPDIVGTAFDKATLRNRITGKTNKVEANYTTDFNESTQLAIRRMARVTQRIVAGQISPREATIQGAKDLGVDKAIEAVNANYGVSSKVTKTLIKKTMKGYRNRAQAIARTESARLHNLAVIDRAEQAQYKYMQVDAIHDGHVCDDCRDLDGTVGLVSAFKDGSLMRPPFHTNCRCILIPTDNAPGLLIA